MSSELLQLGSIGSVTTSTAGHRPNPALRLNTLLFKISVLESTECRAGL